MLKKSMLCLMLMFVTLFFSGYQSDPAISIHDPAMICQNGIYYLFATGKGIRVWSSTDMMNWRPEKAVFDQVPEWTKKAVPGFSDHFWAPDISFHNGVYRLYYSVSTFGKNTSAIGLATNKTLNRDDPHYKWVDQGEVIRSESGKDNWNAIDPNFITDKQGISYLTFGSFWGGIQLIKLAPDGKTNTKIPESTPFTIASRNPEDNNPNPIEAPFIFNKGRYSYLFASIDYCCKGPQSTYKIIVGRSKTLKGPYLDKNGVSLKNGGGTILEAGDKDWYGVGHNAVYSYQGNDYLVYHGYDARDKGVPKLIIKRINWKNNWPMAE